MVQNRVGARERAAAQARPKERASRPPFGAELELLELGQRLKFLKWYLLLCYTSTRLHLRTELTP